MRRHAPAFLTSEPLFHAFSFISSPAASLRDAAGHATKSEIVRCYARVTLARRAVPPGEPRWRWTAVPF
jgi:hypothetical protein